MCHLLLLFYYWFFFLLWNFLFFFLISLVKGLSILFIFSRNQLLVSLIFCIVFYNTISFISTLTFIISFLLLTLGFICYSFSSSFKCKVRLFIWDFSYFLRKACNALNFPLKTVFTVSYRFWVVFLFSSVSQYLLIPSFI